MPDDEGSWTLPHPVEPAGARRPDRRLRLHRAASRGRTGRCRSPDRFHFAYADGTPYFPFGTTCYAWTHQPLAMQDETLATLDKARFNKIRMCVFPKDYIFNTNEPLQDVYQRGADGKLDFDRPNPVAFRHFETQVGGAAQRGIEADIIIFHPYDRWGYADMTRGAGFPLRRLSRGAARGLSQRLVVARQRVRLPARHQADGAVGPLLPHPRGERPLPAPEVDPQRRRADELRSSQGLGRPRLHPELGREAHRPSGARTTASRSSTTSCEYEGNIVQAWGNITRARS